MEKVIKDIMYVAFDAARVGIEDKTRLECVRDHVGDFFRRWTDIYTNSTEGWWKKRGEQLLKNLKMEPTPAWREVASLHEFLLNKRQHDCFQTGLEEMASFIFSEKTKRDYFLNTVKTKIRESMRKLNPEIK